MTRLISNNIKTYNMRPDTTYYKNFDNRRYYVFEILENGKCLDYGGTLEYSYYRECIQDFGSNKAFEDVFGEHISQFFFVEDNLYNVYIDNSYLKNLVLKSNIIKSEKDLTILLKYLPNCFSFNIKTNEIEKACIFWNLSDVLDISKSNFKDTFIHEIDILISAKCRWPLSGQTILPVIISVDNIEDFHLVNQIIKDKHWDRVHNIKVVWHRFPYPKEHWFTREYVGEDRKRYLGWACPRSGAHFPWGLPKSNHIYLEKLIFMQGDINESNVFSPISTSNLELIVSAYTKKFLSDEDKITAIRTDLWAINDTIFEDNWEPLLKCKLEKKLFYIYDYWDFVLSPMPTSPNELIVSDDNKKFLSMEHKSIYTGVAFIKLFNGIY